MKRNKEKISEKNKQPWTCGCGATCRINNKAKHEKTNKHKKSLPNNEQLANE